ncbi:MAG TPA: alpha/beta fold hydrolase [Dictyobacter sp.]|nr:alpha/beta fold hydrolase [Dictyobacter sp.]
MSTYVLVHGAWHGAWCWYRIIPLLEKQGHKVIAPDLPGHGADRSVTIAAGTLRSYTDRIKSIVEAQDEPVILVGHSLGGAVISQVAEEVPASVKKLVYLSAFLLPDGAMIARDENNAQQQHEQSEAEGPGPYLFDEATGLITINPDYLVDLYYHDCNESDIALAKLVVCAEPGITLYTGIHVNDNFARIPRFYIETTNDQAIPVTVQRNMYTVLPCEHVYTLPTGHSSFLVDPEGLGEILTAIDAYAV